MSRACFAVALVLLAVAAARAQESPRWRWPHELRDGVAPDDLPPPTLRRLVFAWERSLAPDDDERVVLDLARLPDGRVALLTQSEVVLLPATLEGDGERIALPADAALVDLPTLLAVCTDRGRGRLQLVPLAPGASAVPLPGPQHATVLGRLPDGAAVVAGLSEADRGAIDVTLHLVRGDQASDVALAAGLGEPAGTLVLPLQLLDGGLLLAASWRADGQSAVHVLDLATSKPRWRCAPGGSVTGARGAGDRVVCATAPGKVRPEALIMSWAARGGALPPAGEALHALSLREGKVLWTRTGGELLTHVIAAGEVDVLADGLDEWAAGVDATGKELWRVEHGHVPTEPLGFEDEGQLVLTSGTLDGGVRFDPRTGTQSAVVEFRRDDRGFDDQEPVLLALGDRLLLRIRGQVLRRGLEDLQVEVYVPEAEQRLEGGATISPDFDEAFPALVEALASDDVRVRRAAAENAARWDPVFYPGAPALVPHLVARLDDADLEVRRRAARALATFGPAGRPGLERLAGGLSHEDEALRLWSAAAVAAIDSQGASAARAGDVLATALAEGHGTPEHHVALRALAHLAPRHDLWAESVRAELACDDLDRVRDALATVEHVAGEAGQPALAARLLPDLVALLREHPERTVRAGAASALGALDDAAAPARAALRAALDDPDDFVRRTACVALCNGPGPEPQDLPRLRDTLAADDWNVRRAAAAGLATLGPPGLEVLVAHVRSGPPRVRVVVIAVLGGCEPDVAAPALPALREAATDADPDVAREAQAALERLTAPR